jgi:chromosomal replication initiator protein
MKEFEQFLEKLDSQLGKPIIDQWVRSLKIVSYDACNLYLEAKDPLQLSWFEEHIKPILKKEFFNQNHHPIKVHIQLPGSSYKNKNGFVDKKEEVSFNFPPLDPLMTFYTFLFQEKNKISYNLLSEISGFNADKKEWQKPTYPLGQMNPIVIYGPKGSGKTHLITSVASALKKQQINVVFATCELFCQHVIQAMRFGHIETLRQIYRQADVLIVDDIDLLANKTATQEEFFHTFNHLHGRGKQILLTCSDPPQQLKNIEERLISRFVWGITLPLYPLNSEQFLPLIQQKCSEFHLSLSVEALQFLQKAFLKLDDLQKALEICLYQKELNSSLNTIEKSHLEEWTASLLAEQKQKKLTPEVILEKVSSYFKIEKEKILSDDQTQEIARVRQITMYLIKKKLNLPYLTLAKIFNRNHSTVMSSVDLISTRIENKEIPILQALNSLEILMKDYS